MTAPSPAVPGESEERTNARPTTAPVTGLVLNIADDATVTLSAADWAAEGHLWAIERRPVSIETLRAVAALLGPDAAAGVEARLRALLDRQRGELVRAEAAAARATDAAARVSMLEALLNAAPEVSP